MPRLPPEIRAQLLVDPFGHRLGQLSRPRLEALGVPGSVEGVVWNVFGFLSQLEPRVWLPALGLPSRGEATRPGVREMEPMRLGLWEPVSVPPSRQEDLRRRAVRGLLRPGAGRMRRGRIRSLSELRRRLASKALAGGALEPPLEIGVTLRDRARLIYILPILDSELEMELECDRDRDAIQRAVDAGLHEMERGRPGARLFRVILLYRDAGRTQRSVFLMRRYRERPADLVRALGHRRKLRARDVRPVLSLLRWCTLARRLSAIHRRGEFDPTDVPAVGRLLGYLEEQGIESGA